MAFDLDQYLARIRLPERPAATAEGLIALQRAHRLAIPFENLDAALGRAIRVDSDAVFAKLVEAKRGGYCFEQNRLFHDALDALGFVARPLLARVWLRDPPAIPNRTHTFSLVTIDGQEWIADPGFGGSYCPPMPLADGETAATPDGALYRLARDPLHGWMLERRGDPATSIGGGTEDAWQAQYSFTTEAIFPSDLELANWWTSTSPDSPFRSGAIVTHVLPHGFASLIGRGYRRRAADSDAAGEIDDPRVYRMRLSLMFGIDLPAEDVAALGLFGQ